MCTKIVFLGTFFSLKNTMLLRYCISEGDRQVFHGDMILVMRVFTS